MIKSLMSRHPGIKMLVGDTGDLEQNLDPTLAEYQTYFGSTYATFVTSGIFRQVRGNHDDWSVGSYTDYNGTVHSSGGAYWTYFGANAQAHNMNGLKLTDYSYNLGNWHIVALDVVSGTVNSTTLAYLKNNLAANTSYKCQLVYWHIPTYASGSAGDNLGLISLNKAEYSYGVDIQINGHKHDYQRFYPINPSGVKDSIKGITTFIDGIGGQAGTLNPLFISLLPNGIPYSNMISLTQEEDVIPGTISQASVAAPASARYFTTFEGGPPIGVIQFTLHANSASYALYNANNSNYDVLDSGTITCH